MIKQFIFQNGGGGKFKINNAWMSYLGTYAGYTPTERNTTGLFHIHLDYEPTIVERVLLYITYRFKITSLNGTAKNISGTETPLYISADSIDDPFVNNNLGNNDIFFTVDLGYSVTNIKKIELIDWSITPNENDPYKYVIKSTSFYNDNVVTNTLWNVFLYSDYSNPGWEGQISFSLYNSSNSDALYSLTTFPDGDHTFPCYVSYLNPITSFNDQLRINFELFTTNWRWEYNYEGCNLPVNLIVNSYNENGYIMTNLSETGQIKVPIKNARTGYSAASYLDDTIYGNCVYIQIQGLWDNVAV